MNEEQMTSEPVQEAPTKTSTGAPTLVKIIGVLYYIGAVLLVLLGIAFFVGASLLGGLLEQIPLLGALGSGLFVVAGIIFIGLAVLYFFIGRGLWKTQNWARIVVIILAAIGAISGIYSIIQGNLASNIVGLIINLAVGGYLLFGNDVKAAFS